MKKELYHISVEIRDDKGKQIKYPDTGYPVGDLKFLWEVRDENHLEHLMKHMYYDLKLLLPTCKISFEASVFNSISDTYMLMYSYYGSEARFVKH